MEKDNLVIDVGNMMKAGFAGQDLPRAVVPSIAGRARVRGIGLGLKEAYYGNEALSKRGIANIKRFVKAGIVEDWDDMEKMMRRIFDDDLRVVPEEHGVLLAANPKEAVTQREKFTQIFFETFDVPGYLPYSQGALAVVSVGRTSGISIDMGEDSSTILPVYEGHGLLGHCVCQDFGGFVLTDYMLKILTERGYSFTTTAEREIVRDIKEKLGYVALDFEPEMKSFAESSAGEERYDLPDAACISIGDERFRCAEPIFNPAFLQKEGAGLQELLAQVINRLDPLEQVPEVLTRIPKDNLIESLPSELVAHVGRIARSAKDLWTKQMETVILTGGGSLFPGLPERLEKEMKLLAHDIPLKVRGPAQREKYSVWMGGSIVAGLSTFQQQVITKEEYDENGPTIVHWKGLY